MHQDVPQRLRIRCVARKNAGTSRTANSESSDVRSISCTSDTIPCTSRQRASVAIRSVAGPFKRSCARNGPSSTSRRSTMSYAKSFPSASRARQRTTGGPVHPSSGVPKT
jgi:hypothetical protein